MAFDTLDNAAFDIILKHTAKKSSPGLKPRSQTDLLSSAFVWTLGTGVAQINAAYVAMLTIAASGNQVLDLTALADTLGNTLAFTAIKSIRIELLSLGSKAPDGVTGGTDCSGIVVGNNGTNPWSAGISDQAAGTITLVNGEKFGRGRFDAPGWTVDGTHKSLKFLNLDASIVAKVVVGIQGIG